MSDIELQELVINEAESDEVVEQQTNLGSNQIIVTPTSSSSVDYAGLPIGAIFASAIPITDIRVHLLDGSLLAQQGIYADFASLIKNLVAAGQPISCTQSDFDADVVRTGNCGKFVIDETNNTIRLPKITTFIQGLSSIANIGKGLDAGLPNITGTFGSTDANGNSYLSFNSNQISGAFSNAYTGASMKYSVDNSTDSSGGWTDKISFNANNGAGTKGIYGNSDTVQPQSTQFPYYIVLATGFKSKLDLDLDNLLHEIEVRTNLDNYYPVGSIYMTMNDQGSPAAIFGGTWERLDDRMLIGAGNLYSGGDTGGSKDAVVVAHTHATNSAGDHQHSYYRYVAGNYNGDYLSESSKGSAWRGGPSSQGDSTSKTGAHSHTIYEPPGSVEGTDKNLPPYLAVYIYQRIE